MGFESERAMHKHVARIAAAFSGQSGEAWVIAHDVHVRYRVPDVIGARLDLRALDDRLAAGLEGSLDASQATALLALRSRTWTDLEVAARRMNVGMVHANRTLRTLAEKGFVQTHGVDPHRYRRENAARFITTRIVAFEAKLKDWRGALIQSRAHQRFANECYVVFDESYESRFLRARDQFLMSKVGLIALTEHTGRYERHLASRVSPWDSTAVALVGESLLGCLLGEPSRPLSESRLPGGEARTSDPIPPKLLGRRSKTLVHRLAAAALL